MKLGSVTKLDEKNKAMSEKFGDDVISENYDVIAIFPICGYKTFIYINRHLLSYKKWKQN